MNQDFLDFDEDENPSDATLLLAEEVSNEFRKAFPLRSELQKSVKVLPARTPNVCKRLNFDETLSPIVMSLNSEMRTSKANLETTEARLSSADREIKRLKKDAEEREEKIIAMINEKHELRTKLVRLEAERQQEKLEIEARLSQSFVTHEDWKMMAKKYYAWYQIANGQLETILEKVKKPSDWNRTTLAEINRAPTQTIQEMNDVTFNDDYVSQLALGSLSSYSGVVFEADWEEVNETAEVQLQPPQNEPTPTFVAKNEPSVFGNVKQEPNDLTSFSRNEPLSPIARSPARQNDTMNYSQMNSTILNSTSIDFEKDDKIQRLLLENSILKDRLDVSTGRAQQSMLLEEKYRSLEHKNDFLQKKLDSTFGEIEAMRIGTARRLFTIEEGQSSEARTLALVDRIRELVADNSRLEKNIEATTSRIQKITRDLTECEKRNTRLEDVYSEETTKNESLEKELQTLKTQLEEQKKITEELKNAQETAASSTLVQPTDAGNTTQIFHMATNPLNLAHQQFQEEESRKRKLSERGFSDDTLMNLEAKRMREEEVLVWEERLRKSEREKENAIRLQMDFFKKFREVSTALTGFQIKMKDAEDGLCCVNSIYDEDGSERQFVFKYYWDSGRLDLLDVLCGTSSGDFIRKWEPEMRKYIGERQSIPSFLAAVTLCLEQERDFDQTVVERNHTFSVIHEPDSQ